MAPTDSLSPPGSSSYLSNTMYVGDGTWIASKNTFLFPNLVGMNFETMRYNGMGNRFSTLKQYHHIIKAHGILAVITFLIIVPAAIMIAQFSTRSRFWAIRLHIYFQILTILLSTVVFTLGWFAVGPSRSFTNPHHGIGLAIYVLILVQGLFGYIIYLRSNNYQTPRKLPLPVMLHEWVGKATALLGFAQVPLGLALYGSPKFTFVLYALWMALLLVLFFILKYKTRPFLYDENLNRVNETTLIEEEGADSRPSKSKAPLSLFAVGAGVATSMREKLNHRNRGSDIIRNEKNQATRQDNQEEVGSYFENEEQRNKNNSGGFLNKLTKMVTALRVFGFIKNRSNKKNNYRDDGYSTVSIDVPARPYRGRPDESATSGVTTSTHQTREDWSRISMPIPDSRHPINTTALDASETQPPMPRPVHRRYSNESNSDLDNSTIPSFHREGNAPNFKNKLLAAIGIGYFAKKTTNRGEQYSSELEREQKRRKITRVRIDEEEEEEERPQNNRNQSAGKPHTSFDQSLHESSDYTSDFSSSESSLASESNVKQKFPSSLTPGASPMIPLPSHRKSGPVETIKMPSIPPDRYGISHQESGVSSQNIPDTQYQKRFSSHRRRDSTADFTALNNETTRQAAAAETSRKVALAGAAKQVASTENPRQADIAESSRHGEALDNFRRSEHAESSRHREVLDNFRNSELAESSRHGEIVDNFRRSEHAESSRHQEVLDNFRNSELAESSRHGEVADNFRRSEFAEASRQITTTKAARYAASEEEEWKRSRSRVAKISTNAGDGLETTISVKVKVHEDKNHVTLRRLTKEEVAAEREAKLASRRWRRTESVSSISARDTAASHRRYRRSESESGRQPEYLTKSIPPAQAVTPSPGLVAGRKPVDSAYYPLQREPSKSGRLSATLAGSPESYETWSAMSPGNDDSGEAAAERRRRRRFERSQRSGVESGLIGEGTKKSIDNNNI
ncbi:putative cytochrome b561 ferric reductase transmembrane [Erysiphe neolycopersici]|uniref:Putative cytochrome b561 ferric reductase transmembrane n=1 Tax=Erysiphe neolycopersici TaxID=212602 RepID=A0A420HIA3_9PEZI|nr:putative cytochrome b561 ferric reductase transmembrane [Erysiphe neolycopersici]